MTNHGNDHGKDHGNDHGNGERQNVNLRSAPI
jgi:hypothetical protein